MGLWIIGDGDLAYDLHELSLHLRIAENVNFLGFQENPYPYFKNADAFILSSRFEGMPNVVLEALSLEKTIISTSAGRRIEFVK